MNHYLKFTVLETNKVVRDCGRWDRRPQRRPQDVEGSCQIATLSYLAFNEIGIWQIGLTW